MKIVIMTNEGSIFGKKLINKFIEKKILIDKIVIIKQSFSYNIKLFKLVLNKTGLFQAVFFSLRKIFKQCMIKYKLRTCKNFIFDYCNMNVPFITTFATNSLQTEKLLKKIKPDIIILGQTGIVKKNILDIPAIGTINAHPGILPEYRGIDSYKWALFNDDYDKIGATVHWVDEKIDSGNIIFQELYEIKKNESLDSLESNVNELAVELMAKAIADMISSGIVKGRQQKNELSRQYFKMPLKLEYKTAAKLKKYFLNRQV